MFALIAATWVLTGSDSANEAARLMEFSPTWQLAAIWVASCFVVLMLVVLKSKNSQKDMSKTLLVLTGLLAVHLSWGIRWIILIQSQVVPKYGAGTYFYEISWGPDGILGIAGTFGLWIAIVTLLSEILRSNQSST
jgi:tetrathionate reductase subunit C